MFPEDQSGATRNAPPAQEPVPRWEHFAHQADIGIRGIGQSVEEAFEQAGMALTAVMVAPEAIQLRNSTAIECEASDLEVLFVDWLNAIVFEMATSRMLFGAFTSALTRPASRRPLLASGSIRHGTSRPSRSKVLRTQLFGWSGTATARGSPSVSLMCS